jgi:hypothetical protein
MNWIEISEVVRNFGLVAAGAVGIYLAWKRVTVSNRLAMASLQHKRS